MAGLAGIELIEDRDITENTLPTYPTLLALIGSGAMEGASGRMKWPTKLLQWLSVSRILRYRVLSFKKP